MSETAYKDPIEELKAKLEDGTIESDYGKAGGLDEINKLDLSYFLGKGSLASMGTQALSQHPASERPRLGELQNKNIEKLKEISERANRNAYSKEDDSKEWFDVTFPATVPTIGHLSPDTQVIREMNKFFIYHGYSIAEGPDIETELYNFEKTNLPKDHPARDLQDTIYVESPNVLLRTHTSSVETRILERYKPPVRFVVPGVSFRNEILNQSNHAIFYQYQGVCVDKGISMANLKATLEEFAKYMYGNSVETRFRTKYYPEVEPGAGLDILCSFCQGEGCRICKGRGWLEILGSGMIHRKLLENCGIDFNEWSGFAFGMGLDRIIMTKFGIEDIRDLHGGSLVYENSL